MRPADAATPTPAFTWQAERVLAMGPEPAVWHGRQKQGYTTDESVHEIFADSEWVSLARSVADSMYALGYR